MKTNITEMLRQNLNKLLADNNLDKRKFAEKVDIEETTMGKILNGKQGITLDHLERISNGMGLRIIDLYTYPDKYVKVSTDTRERVSITFELTPENRDILLERINSVVK